MKKVAKVLLAFVLIIGVGFTGYTIGKNTSSTGANLSEADQNHMLEMDQMKDLIKENYLFDYDDEEIYDGSLKGMFANLGDPYTQYYTKDEFTKLMESINGKYAGIGVVVQASQEGYIKAVQVFADSPAEKAGIKAGDYITKVDGVAYTDDEMEEAVAHMKGEAGTKVKLTITRTSSDKKTTDKDVEVERANVTVETVASKMIETDGRNIGYINLKQFEDVSYDEFMKHLNALEDDGAEGIVLDLRNNPGGALDVCLKIADTFLDEGTIVSTVDKNDKEIVEESDAEKDSIPMVVLVNENSASASEILAGALQDRDRATIVGTTTFGKGIVQKVFPLDNGAGAKITVSEYFTPNKNEINKIGVKPDKEIEYEGDSSNISIDNLDDDYQFLGALEVLTKQLD